jgi:hypothetical protein
MCIRKLVVTSSLIFIASVAWPSQAAADWVFTPFIGGTFGGNANVRSGSGGTDDATDFERSLSYGASLMGIGDKGVGFELDFGYSPNFFGGTTNSAGVDFVGDGNVTTLMGNLVIGASGGPIRPYASGGVGLLKSKVDSAGQFFSGIDTTDWGINAGAGVMGFFSHNIGIRGDVRFFRSLSNADPGNLEFKLGDFKFWRGTVGLSFGF